MIIQGRAALMSSVFYGLLLLHRNLFPAYAGEHKRCLSNVAICVSVCPYYAVAEGEAARHRRDRQVAAAQAALWERVLAGDQSIPFTENGFDIPVDEQLRLARAGRPPPRQ
jgi:NAD-dependent dihydropyrimidine dehydrogenase PreA subunit